MNGPRDVTFGAPAAGAAGAAGAATAGGAAVGGGPGPDTDSLPVVPADAARPGDGLGSGPRDDHDAATPAATAATGSADADGRVVVVGLGADGWHGLAPASRAALAAAGAVVGSERQRALVRGHHSAAETDLPSPLRAGLASLVGSLPGPVVVLASGDPLHFGIGRTLVDLLGAERIDVMPAVSSMALACARMRWPVEDTTVVSLVGRPESRLRERLHDGARLLVLVPDRTGPQVVAGVLRDAGFGQSPMTVLTDLGTANETHTDGAAMWWADPAASDLAIVAVDVRGQGRSLVPGLPDDAYESDGQLTKRHVRAATLAALGPRPGELLWDVGGGSGSIGIEWLRAHPTCRAVAVESSPERAARIARNAAALAGGRLDVVTGRAPGALAGLERPDAVFVGGGLTAPGLLDAVTAAVRPGGRVVANTVTLDSEALLFDWFRRLGGILTRLEISHADAVGSFTSWSAARPVTQWVWTRSADPHADLRADRHTATRATFAAPPAARPAHRPAGGPA